VVVVHHEVQEQYGIVSENGMANVQLQECQVGIAVICLVLTLLHDIVLEYGGRLGVVPVEAIEDLINVLGPVGRVVKGSRHGGLAGGCCDGSLVERSWVTILTVEDD
jgi:hypothetical protein